MGNVCPGADIVSDWTVGADKDKEVSDGGDRWSTTYGADCKASLGISEFSRIRECCGASRSSSFPGAGLSQKMYF